MREALARANLSAADVEYINLHGTATPSNDASEDQAVMSVFGAQTPCSSTKGYTGHTPGAAGIVEAVFSLLAIKHALLPASVKTRANDPLLRVVLVIKQRAQPVGPVVLHAFGFGGTTALLLL